MLTVIWACSAILALRMALCAWALLNALVSRIIGACTLPTLGEALFEYDAYVRRHCAAALHQLPLDVPALVLRLLAVGFSLAAIRRGRVLFLLGWLSNAPMIALPIYLAFWFHIF